MSASWRVRRTRSAGRADQLARDDLDRSDHEQFWRRGIPAVLLTGTATLRSPHYHRDCDTPDTLDYARLAQVADSLAATLAAAPADLGLAERR